MTNTEKKILKRIALVIASYRKDDWETLIDVNVENNKTWREFYQEADEATVIEYINSKLTDKDYEVTSYYWLDDFRHNGDNKIIFRLGCHD